MNDFLGMEEVAPREVLDEGLYQFFPHSINTRHLQEISLRWPVTVEVEPNAPLRTLLKKHLYGLEAFGYGPVPKPDDLPSIGRFAFDILSYVPQAKNCGFFTGKEGEKRKPAQYAVFVRIDYRSQIVFCADFSVLAEFLRVYQDALLRPVQEQGRQMFPIG